MKAHTRITRMIVSDVGDWVSEAKVAMPEGWIAATPSSPRSKYSKYADWRARPPGPR
jgi:hypothetical protein